MHRARGIPRTAPTGQSRRRLEGGETHQECKRIKYPIKNTLKIKIPKICLYIFIYIYNFFFLKEKGKNILLIYLQSYFKKNRLLGWISSESAGSLDVRHPRRPLRRRHLQPQPRPGRHLLRPRPRRSAQLQRRECEVNSVEKID